jgi:hypothetical protein
MAPSREMKDSSTSSLTNTSDEIVAAQKGDSALAAAKRNFRYLLNPSTQAAHPARLRTRALLRSVRYFCSFILWRLVRYSKVIVAGAIVTALGATAFGSAITGVAWIAVPTSITAVVASGTVWTLGKWAVRRFQNKRKKTTVGNGVPQRQVTEEIGPGAVPW